MTIATQLFAESFDAVAPVASAEERGVSAPRLHWRRWVRSASWLRWVSGIHRQSRYRIWESARC